MTNTTTESAPVAETIPADSTPPVEATNTPIKRRRLKRGRHPAPTAGAFGGKRKTNGISFRTSELISRFR